MNMPSQYVISKILGESPYMAFEEYTVKIVIHVNEREYEIKK